MLKESRATKIIAYKFRLALNERSSGKSGRQHSILGEQA
jgi:hypothetical protein